MRVRSTTNMRFLALTVVLAFAVSGCFGLFSEPPEVPPPPGGTVTGRLVFEWDTPIEGAEIAIAELEIATVTGSDGRFAFAQIPPGTYTLEARKDGSVLVEKVVTVVENAEVDVLLRDNGPNLIVNPWFDEIDENTGMPVGWIRFGGTVGTTVWITDEDFVEGGYSYKGYQDSENTVGMRSTRFPVQPGETYQLTVWVKAIQLEGVTDQARASIAIETWPNEHTVDMDDREWLTASSVSPEWTQLTVTFEVPEGKYWADAILFTVRNQRGITYWNAPRMVKVE